MRFESGDGWADWQRAYRYGLFVMEPPSVLASALNLIRERVDPVSAAAIGAHISLTPPLTKVPNTAAEGRIEAVIRSSPPITLRLGQPTQFPGSSVVYLPVSSPAALGDLRTALLAVTEFRLDLPHMTDFVPHLTLSHFGDEVAALAARVPGPDAMTFSCTRVDWLVPDSSFAFQVRRVFTLGGTEGITRPNRSGRTRRRTEP
jgi:2'-5' RNA ligase